VRTGPVSTPPSLLKIPPPGDDRPAVEDIICTSDSSGNDGESFEEMRKKRSQIRYPLTAFSAADLIAFDEGAVWLVTMVKSRRGAEWGAPRAGFENSTAGTA
jgi:hypothetical protein